MPTLHPQPTSQTMRYAYVLASAHFPAAKLVVGWPSRRSRIFYCLLCCHRFVLFIPIIAFGDLAVRFYLSIYYGTVCFTLILRIYHCEGAPLWIWVRAHQAACDLPRPQCLASARPPVLCRRCCVLRPSPSRPCPPFRAPSRSRAATCAPYGRTRTGLVALPAEAER